MTEEQMLELKRLGKQAGENLRATIKKHPEVFQVLIEERAGSKGKTTADLEQRILELEFQLKFYHAELRIANETIVDWNTVALERNKEIIELKDKIASLEKV